jgi:MurNAc alpha-1-phosphate uridylyltransferase
MRPLTNRLPKPLVPVAGRPLIDHVLDRIAAAGIARAIVNVHFMADRIEAHLAGRAVPAIAISDERERLLDTGGGVRRALPLLGADAFLVHNSDAIWIEHGVSNLLRLCAAFDPARMDGLMLLADRATSRGYSGHGDFELGAEARLVRVTADTTAACVFAGVSIAHPRLLRDTPEGPFSLNRVWDRALAEGRLFGHLLEGTWMHVGDSDAVAAAERCLADAASR